GCRPPTECGSKGSLLPVCSRRWRVRPDVSETFADPRSAAQYIDIQRAVPLPNLPNSMPPLCPLEGAMSPTEQISRRSFLMAATAASASVVTGRLGLAREAADPYGGFRMGLQSYSLREFDLETALGHSRDLGLK